MSAMRRLTCEAVEDLAPLYVLGALDAADTAAVRAHRAGCSRAHDELATLGGVVPYLADSVPQVEPPAALGDRVRAAVAADVRAQRRDDSAAERLLRTIGATATPGTRATPVAPPAPSPAPPAAPIELTDRRRAASTMRVRPLLELAAVVLIAALAGWNLLLQGQVGNLRERDEQMRAAVVAAGGPDAVVASVSGAEPAPGAGGFAVLTPGEPGYLVVTGLPAPPVGRTYQAWYIVNGTPRSAGLMDVGSDGTGVMRGLQHAAGLEAVAISQERAGGSPTPTEVYAVGEIGG